MTNDLWVDDVLAGLRPGQDRLTQEFPSARQHEILANIVDKEHDSRVPQTRVRWNRPHYLTVAAAGVMTIAAVIAVTVVVGRANLEPTRTSAATGVSLSPGVPADGAPAVRLLAALSDAAQKQPAIVPRPDQFVYVKTRSAGLKYAPENYDDNGHIGDPPPDQTPTPLSTRAVWIAQGPPYEGLIQEHDNEYGVHGAGEDDSLYQRLVGWPTDPGQLRSYVYGLTRARGERWGADYAAFQYFGNLLESALLPPGLCAAIYRAVAQIPGVQLVTDALDADGRRGPGVALTSGAVRSEWIFDPHTRDYLGQRTTTIRDTSSGPAGTTVSVTAVLAKGIVDKLRQTPTE